MSITPVCERILLWLDQLRGYCSWSVLASTELDMYLMRARNRQSRFGHLHLEQRLIEECVPLVQAIMLNAARLEALSLDEELGFRDLVGWLKFGKLSLPSPSVQAKSQPQN